MVIQRIYVPLLFVCRNVPVDVLLRLEYEGGKRSSRSVVDGEVYLRN